MNNKTLLMGAAIGAGLIYVLDPQTGRRRRALMRDKLSRATTGTWDACQTTTRDVGNRSRGIAAATRARLRTDEVADEKLEQRVRAKLGRVCSHPRAIEVTADGGHVTLSGPLLAHEAPEIVAMAESVRGVRSVSNQLETHATASNVPALQGDGSVGEPGLDLLQSRWAPATRAMVATAGVAAAALLGAGYTRRERDLQEPR
jgi:osmotically-inducible protein OsmY